MNMSLPTYDESSLHSAHLRETLVGDSAFVDETLDYRYVLRQAQDRESARRNLEYLLQMGCSIRGKLLDGRISIEFERGPLKVDNFVEASQEDHQDRSITRRLLDFVRSTPVFSKTQGATARFTARPYYLEYATTQQRYPGDRVAELPN